MSSTPTPPVVPVPDDDDGAADNLVGGDDAAADNLVGGDEKPLDPDLNDELVISAEADRRAATEGEVDGSEEH